MSVSRPFFRLNDGALPPHTLVFFDATCGCGPEPITYGSVSDRDGNAFALEHCPHCNCAVKIVGELRVRQVSELGLP